MNIAYIGNFVNEKGSSIFTDLVNYYHPKHKWFIFGYIGDLKNYKSIKKKISLQEEYNFGKLNNSLIKNKIDLSLVLSTWAETYSMTFFESITANVPTITNELGYPYFLLKKQYNLFFDSKKPIESIVKLIDYVDKNKDLVDFKVKDVSNSVKNKLDSTKNIYEILSK